jgi:hypothetical protein
MAMFPLLSRKLMNNKNRSTAFCVLAVSLFVLSCSQLSTHAMIPTNIASPVSTIVATVTVPPVVINTDTPAPTPMELAVETNIAYVQNNMLFVTHVIGGQPIDTQQYTDHAAIPFVISVGWSPSGEYLTYSAYINSFPHTVFVNPSQRRMPVDLGLVTRQQAAGF